MRNGNGAGRNLRSVKVQQESSVVHGVSFAKGFQIMTESPTTKCTWTYAEEEDCWETSCGNTFVITCDTPEDHGMRFCSYCGKPLEQFIPDPHEAENERAALEARG